jgi:hypothetical protein
VGDCKIHFSSPPSPPRGPRDSTAPSLDFGFIVEKDELAPGPADGLGGVWLRVRTQDLHLLLRGNLPSFVVTSMLKKVRILVKY